jgi:glycosyltransferase involved in cell wall biosynthesis
MLLLDALYINQGGGLRLLKYLVRSLQEKKFEFHLLADKRCRGLFDHIANVEYADASICNRYKYYKAHQNTYSKVFCLGNVPPPIRLPIKVYTYLQNINLLNLDGCVSNKRRALTWFKRSIVILLKNNTDLWIVQTDNTRHELMHHLQESESKVKVVPFYDVPKSSEGNGKKSDYIYISGFNFGNKGHYELIEAWKILHERGYDLKLHLTIDKKEEMLKEIKTRYDLNELHIDNHGIISYDKVQNLYLQSKATVYPSRNESLGLGIIEAINNGCDVIGSDLPFVYDVCNPSEVFNQSSPMSIADAVERYENGNSPKSELLVENKISELIDILRP